MVNFHGMCLIYIGDISIEKIDQPKTKRNVYLFSYYNDLLSEQITTNISSDMCIFHF